MGPDGAKRASRRRLGSCVFTAAESATSGDYLGATLRRPDSATLS